MKGRKRTAIIIGAGPAGLTAAYELLQKTDIKPIVLEATNDIGGLSRTANYKGNRIDIGGHRFFSKSDRVMEWWQNILPLEITTNSRQLRYKGQARNLAVNPTGIDSYTSDNVMLVRHRVSRIYFGGKFYNYPITLELSTLKNLGSVQIAKVGFSYIKARLFPRDEGSLEDFYINRFGKELYQTFFKSYTEKVWGISCANISADWGAQRVKGLSVSGALIHALKRYAAPRENIKQKDTETSLIEYFLYPKYGPGQMWELVAQRIQEQGGIIVLNCPVTSIKAKGNTIESVCSTNSVTNRKEIYKGDYFMSTMPIKNLMEGLEGIKLPDRIEEIARNLPYRDFLTVGVLLKKLQPLADSMQSSGNNMVPDNWIYIQEPNVLVGRIQVFNNWSPYMVQDQSKIWLGMEYFVNEGDALWNKSDAEMKAFAIQELETLGMIKPKDVVDTAVLRVRKAYPAYFGSYKYFSILRNYLDKFENLYLMGRNGMHRYNNQDHSMLTAMKAVENIQLGRKSKRNIWDTNVEKDYHESKG